MPSPNDPSSPPPSTPQERAVQEVLTCFDAYARIRAARDSFLSASRVGPREEERAFGDLQQAISRLRTASRPQ
ncbi:hypothetical protein [Streptomyces mirabilis]|jgi:hypothetical protein|uniref:Uncharacterized protein n=1 Tax=Streptomyces mirabilis TaxID=68239 RepID=A0A1I2X0G0_9ACTN|nr:hypothetical protein [Streptomyces mirabilis]SFH05421.1 hypothetical protein SAMN02787118_14045 [Streptomyces mirabilis]